MFSDEDLIWPNSVSNSWHPLHWPTDGSNDYYWFYKFSTGNLNGCRKTFVCFNSPKYHLNVFVSGIERFDQIGYLILWLNLNILANSCNCLIELMIAAMLYIWSVLLGKFFEIFRVPLVVAACCWIDRNLLWRLLAKLMSAG